jgi:nitroreductase
MDIEDVMRTAGSTRRHRPDPVPGDVIYRVLDNARFAPSGGNRQPWRVIVVTDRAVRASLSEIYRQSWYEFHAPLFTAPGELPQPDYYADHMHLVPVQLVVLVSVAGITTTNAALDTSRIVGGAGIYPFVQNLILGIRAEGLGTTLTTVLVPVEDEVKRLLRIPDQYHIAAHLGVGWPERPFPARLSRHPVEDFATADHFDGSPVGR